MGQLLPLHYHHLAQVADLLEVAFQHVMDREGRAFLKRLRQLSHSLLPRPASPGWIEELGLKGWVWLEDGRVVGHAAIYPAPRKGEFILVNVAVAPEYRRRGIATALVQAVMEDVRRQQGTCLWLEVDEENQAARRLYQTLGFTYTGTWYRWGLMVPRPSAPQPRPRLPRMPLYRMTRSVWEQVYPWLRAWYPKDLDWRYPVGNLDRLRPGWWPWLYRKFLGMRTTAWYVGRSNRPAAAMFWFFMPRGGWQRLFLAAPEEVEEEVIAGLVRPLYRRPYVFLLDAPRRTLEEVLPHLGFQLRRRLEVWRWRPPQGRPRASRA